MDVRYRLLVFVLIVNCSWIKPSAAQAVRTGSAQTIEWLAAEADVVVRARVDDRTIPPVGPWSRSGARAVETIKGKVAEGFEFAAYSSPELLRRYRGREVLLFLDSENRHIYQQPNPPPCPLVLGYAAAQWQVIGLDGDPADFAVTMDLTVLTRPESIMAAARAAVAYSAGRPRPKIYWLPVVPFKTEVSERVSGFNSAGMFFPLDDRLPRKAREWTKSPNPFVRVEGAGILSRYRTEENIAILKAFLSDTTIEGGQYLVRTGAFNVLTGWGVDCGNPVLKP